MISTFLDSDVLIFAARGIGERARRSFEILDDPRRKFLSSPFLELEIIPKAKYYRNSSESEFYRTFFGAVSEHVEVSTALVARAQALAEQFGLSAMDSLHIEAATMMNADEFITGEKPSSPIFRVEKIKIISLFA